MKGIANNMSRKKILFFICMLEALTAAGCKETKNRDNTTQISLEIAEEKALADAGLAESEITSIKTKMDQDGGISVYHVEFYTDNAKYEYELNASNGNINSRSRETFAGKETVQDEKPQITDSQNEAIQNQETQVDDFQNVDQAGLGTNQGHHVENHYGYAGDVENDIGQEEAKNIAVSHAGFSDADVRFTKVEFDWEDGQAVYEVEFYKDAREYEYTISASTGVVLEYDID